MTELQEAIEAVYRAFAPYPLKDVIVGCPHCVSGDDSDQLHTAPLRQLTAQNFRRYAYKALTTWGDIDDFRHFLPRLLELVASGKISALADNEIIFGKLRYGEWEIWRKSEVQAIRDYFAALWHYQLSQPSNDSRDWLRIVAQAEDNLEQYLQVWLQTSSFSARLHLAQFIAQNGITAIPKQAFWKDREPQAEQVRQWLSQPEVLRILQDAFVQYIDTDYAEVFALAIDKLEQDLHRVEKKVGR